MYALLVGDQWGGAAVTETTRSLGLNCASDEDGAAIRDFPIICCALHIGPPCHKGLVYFPLLANRRLEVLSGVAARCVWIFTLQKNLFLCSTSAGGIGHRVRV